MQFFSPSHQRLVLLRRHEDIIAPEFSFPSLPLSRISKMFSSSSFSPASHALLLTLLLLLHPYVNLVHPLEPPGANEASEAVEEEAGSSSSSRELSSTSRDLAKSLLSLDLGYNVLNEGRNILAKVAQNLISSVTARSIDATELKRILLFRSTLAIKNHHPP